MKRIIAESVKFINSDIKSIPYIIETCYMYYNSFTNNSKSDNFYFSNCSSHLEAKHE